MNSSTSNTIRRFPVWSIALGLLAVALYFIPGARETMHFDLNDSVVTPWRAIASHWIHWSAQHLAWSGGAFVALGILCERMNRRAFLMATALSAALIPPALVLSSASVATYAGLSGIDSALFGLVCVQLARRGLENGERMLPFAIGALLLGFAAKIGYELHTGTAFFAGSDNGMVPVPLAHIVGLAVGLVVGEAAERFRRGESRVVATTESPQSCVR